MEEPILVLLGLILMFVLLFLSFLLFFACSRRLRNLLFRSRTTVSGASLPSSCTSHLHGSKDDDLETPLFSAHGQSSSLPRNLISCESSFQSVRNVISPRRTSLLSKPNLISAGDSVVLDVVTDASEEFFVGHTLKHPVVTTRPVEEVKRPRRESVNYDAELFPDNDAQWASASNENGFQRSCLNLDVISGPSTGLHYSRESANSLKVQLTLGRVTPSDLLLKDSEVSGRHALINWNANKLKWELMDMGSLNGTFLNSRAIHHADSGYRRWSEPVELSDGDIITLGTSTKLLVGIFPSFINLSPFGVGVASDPMAMRRGGKKLPMEDLCYCQWPLNGVEKFGLFGIFDGHGGVGAAKTASKLLPLMITNIMSNPERRKRVLSICDASEVLRDAFSETEAAMNHQYEGCTATVLLVWSDHVNDFFAQCANVGDSACVISVNGTTVTMTEDHRVTSLSEKTRLKEAGMPLQDGETRICGLNLVRMLGDKFLKEQDPRFSSDPFISEVVHMERRGDAFALMASDGLWDVIGIKKAVQLVFQAMERRTPEDSSAVSIANFVLNEAKNLRTKDNTSVIFLDFSSIRIDSCKVNS